MPIVSYQCVQLSLVREKLMYIRKYMKLVGMEGSDRYFETFVNCGRVKLASSRSPRWNCRSRKF